MLTNAKWKIYTMKQLARLLNVNFDDDRCDTCHCRFITGKVFNPKVKMEVFIPHIFKCSCKNEDKTIKT